MTAPVLAERHGRVEVLTLNRPEQRNAYTYEMQDALHDEFERASADPRIHAIVLTGAGPVFCPGFDGAALQAAAESGGRDQRSLRPITLPALVPKPIVCAINGGCAGIGLVTALLCDIRIAAGTARMSTAFARLGLPAERTASWLLQRIVGHAAALDLLLTARTVDADEALRLGLVNRVCPPEAVLDAAIETAGRTAVECSPRALAAIKRQMYADWTRTLDESRLAAADGLADLLAGPDFALAIAALRTGGVADFSGLSAGPDLPGAVQSV